MTSRLGVAIGLAGAKWAPVYVLTWITMWFQVPGCPRCPVAAARAIAALAHARGDVRGPAPAQRRALTRWNKLARLANSHWQQDPHRRPGSSILAVGKAAAIVRQRARNLAAARGPRLGRALYVAAWTQRHFSEFRSWLRGASARRRWAPGTRLEWQLLAHARCFTSHSRVPGQRPSRAPPVARDTGQTPAPVQLLPVHGPRGMAHGFSQLPRCRPVPPLPGPPAGHHGALGFPPGRPHP